MRIYSDVSQPQQTPKINDKLLHLFFRLESACVCYIVSYMALSSEILAVFCEVWNLLMFHPTIVHTHLNCIWYSFIAYISEYWGVGSPYMTLRELGRILTPPHPRHKSDTRHPTPLPAYSGYDLKYESIGFESHSNVNCLLIFLHGVSVSFRLLFDSWEGR